MAEERTENAGMENVDSTVRTGENTVENNTSNPDQESNKTVSVNGEKVDGEVRDSRDISNANLIRYSDLTPDEKRAFHSAGGKAGAKSKRQKKAAKEILETLLTAQMSREQIEDVLGTAESLLGSENSAYAVMLAKMLQEGCAGNVQAAAFVRDTAGDKPTDKQEVTAAVTAGDVALLEKVGARLGIKKADELTE